MKKILTWEEAAELSGFTENQLKKAVRNGELEAMWRDNRSYGVTEDAIENFQKSKKLNPLTLKKIK